MTTKIPPEDSEPIVYIGGRFLAFDDKKTWLSRGPWLALEGMQYCLFEVEVTELNH